MFDVRATFLDASFDYKKLARHLAAVTGGCTGLSLCCGAAAWLRGCFSHASGQVLAGRVWRGAAKAASRTDTARHRAGSGRLPAVGFWACGARQARGRGARGWPCARQLDTARRGSGLQSASPERVWPGRSEASVFAGYHRATRLAARLLLHAHIRPTFPMRSADARSNQLRVTMASVAAKKLLVASDLEIWCVWMGKVKRNLNLDPCPVFLADKCQRCDKRLRGLCARVPPRGVGGHQAQAGGEKATSRKGGSAWRAARFGSHDFAVAGRRASGQGHADLCRPGTHTGKSCAAAEAGRRARRDAQCHHRLPPRRVKVAS